MAVPTSTSKDHIPFQRYIFIAGIVLFIIKFVAFYITNSVGILSDALESSINIITGFITLKSLQYASKPRDEDHPYGHGKVELITASIEGILIGVAGILILTEAIKRLHDPLPIITMDLGIILILFTAIINLLIGFWSVQRGKKGTSIALISSGHHLMSDAYSTFALILGLLAYWLTGKAWLDSILAIFFGCFILITGYKLLRTTVNGLMDEADNQFLHQLSSVLQDHRRAAWIDIHKLTSLKFGAVVHIDFHLSLPWYYNVRQANEEISMLKECLRKNLPNQELDISIQSEPCMPSMCSCCTLECTERKHALQQPKTWTFEQITGKKIVIQSNR